MSSATQTQIQISRPTCMHVMTRGERKGQQCPVRPRDAGQEYCSKHRKCGQSTTPTDLVRMVLARTAHEKPVNPCTRARQPSIQIQAQAPAQLPQVLSREAVMHPSMCTMLPPEMWVCVFKQMESVHDRQAAAARSPYFEQIFRMSTTLEECVSFYTGAHAGLLSASHIRKWYGVSVPAGKKYTHHEAVQAVVDKYKTVDAWVSERSLRRLYKPSYPYFDFARCDYSQGFARYNLRTRHAR